MLHAGGKFGGAGYKVSGGLHGVGVSVVNALSEWLELDIYVDGYHWHERFERGAPVGELVEKEKLAKDAPPAPPCRSWPTPTSSRRSTTTSASSPSACARRPSSPRACASSSTTSAPRARASCFQYDGGIVDFVAYINRDKDAIHRSIIFLENETEDGAVEIAMQWNSSYNESIFTFANNINTTEGGAHLSGFRSRAHAHDQRLRPPEEPPQGEGGEPHRRGRARGPDGAHLGQAQEPAVRGPDQDQARQHRDPALWSSQRSTRSWPSSSRRTPPRAGRSSTRPSTRRGRAAPRARRATSRAARALLEGSTLPGKLADCSIKDAAQQRDLPRRGRLRRRLRQAGARPLASRPSCRCAARSSTSRRRASTRCSPTTRSAP